MSQTWERVYLGLGTNLGDRAANLETATQRLAAMQELRVLRRSSLYETEPVGVADQPWFLNTVLEAETTLQPKALLRRTRAIEVELGRQPGPRWGPRLIDIDILLYDKRAVHSAELQIPHRQLWNRLFVLVPLAELQPQLEGPSSQPISARIAELRNAQAVRLF